jgi:hypothetical protein
LPNFSKSSQNSSQAGKISKHPHQSIYDSSNDLHPTTFESLKCLQPTVFETAYLGKNIFF